MAIELSISCDGKTATYWDNFTEQMWKEINESGVKRKYHAWFDLRDSTLKKLGATPRIGKFDQIDAIVFEVEEDAIMFKLKWS